MVKTKEDLSDISSIEDEDLGLTTMPEFKRELLLAERHAEHLKRKQRKSLLKETPNDTNIHNLSVDDSFDDNIDYLDDTMDVDDGKDDRQLSDKILFGDDTTSPKEVVKYVTASSINAARLSKTRALHILEHPNCNDYLYGVILNVYVSVGSDVEISGSRPIYITLPKFLGKHVVFQVERVVKVDEYDVYGSKFSNCDHDTRSLIGKCGFKLLGRVLSYQPDSSSNVRCIVSLSDICNEPITDDAINFGDSILARELQQVANNLKCFTFTDEDNKISDGIYKGGRAGLINAIQRCSHEIELLVEAAKNDPSKLQRLADHERKKQSLEEQLKNYKNSTPSAPLFVKNTAILRATNDNNSKLGITRKTTKPTPMIMVPNLDNDHVVNEEVNTNQWKRSINDLIIDKQEHIISSYLNNIKQINAKEWLDSKVVECPFTNYIKLSEYKKA